MTGRRCWNDGAAVSRGGRARTVCLIAAIAAGVKSIAPHGAWHAAAILTLALVCQAGRVATGWLVRSVVAVAVAVAEIVHRYALATVTGVLRGGTESSAIGLVASIPAINKSITAAIKWQARSVVAAVKSITSAFAVVLVSHVVAVEMPIAAALFGDAESVGAAPLVVKALGVVDAVYGDVVESPAELAGS